MHITELLPEITRRDNDFFELSSSHIRFWNYNITEQPYEEIFLNLFENIKQKITEFTAAEETIYKSCGMPTKFKIKFSSTFSSFGNKLLSKQVYHKVNVVDMKDLQKDETKKFMTKRKKLFSIFEGGDRLRLYRETPKEVSDIIHEINFITNTYRIPLFCYDFSQKKEKEVKLTNFFE